MKYLLSALLLAASAAVQASVITPVPASVTPQEGKPFVFTPRTGIRISGVESADSLRLLSASGLTAARKGAVSLTVDPALGAEAYTLSVTNKGINIAGGDAAGLFYGLQTLRDLRDDSDTVPAQVITDSPYLAYRGVMLDISRHWRDKDFILKQIDAMARLNLNRLHLHLTDAAGWRIQIDRYPQLTEVAAFRPQAIWKDWSEAGMQWGGEYGGYLTKEDVAEIVKYAADHYITVIPEIEMPSHSEEVLYAYPLLSCTHSPRGCSNYCASSEAAYEFLCNVLDEIVEMFPSEYIHIGGDEAPKDQWTKCPDCQALMEAEGLENSDYLQSRFMRRIEEHLATKGRKAIMWDDALEGDGPTDSAMILSWRGAVPSDRPQSRMVMSPGRPYYLDAYQDAPHSQPEAIGGYVPLNVVYEYDAPAGAYGVQGNVWCEYIPTAGHFEYMLYPRLFAIAETGWSQPERKDWADFRARAEQLAARMRSNGYNTFDITTEVGNRPGADAPVEHLAVGKPVKYVQPFWKSYPAGGDTALVDGVIGSWTYSDQRWQGFATDTDERMDVIIDLGEPMPIHEVTATFMQLCGPWVWMPEHVIISASTDGENFTTLAEHFHTQVRDWELSLRPFGWESAEGVTARYVRYRATANHGILFTDEIIVR